MEKTESARFKIYRIVGKFLLSFLAVIFCLAAIVFTLMMADSSSYEQTGFICGAGLCWLNFFVILIIFKLDKIIAKNSEK